MLRGWMTRDSAGRFECFASDEDGDSSISRSAPA
jgi:hypothetical protein